MTIQRMDNVGIDVRWADPWGASLMLARNIPPTIS
jgi:hypothetical protein